MNSASCPLLIVQKDFRDTFHAVVKVIEEEFLPAVRRHALIGEARVITRNPEVLFAPSVKGSIVQIGVTFVSRFPCAGLQRATCYGYGGRHHV